MEKRRGTSYQKRVAEINAIYDKYNRMGLSNREIWRRYIFPLFGICERQFYYALKVSEDPRYAIPEDQEPFLKFEDWDDDKRDRQGGEAHSG